MADDKTGWILACASGLACVAGSSIICLDLLTRQVPRWKHFSIRESTTFLSASLSLSFGVMFYSALYGMLPKAHSYFLADLSSSAAAYATIGCFLAGVAGLQLVSDTLHHLLPSSIVNCEEHSGSSSSSESKPHPSNRDLEAGGERGGQHHHHLHHHDHSRDEEEEAPEETTPLLPPQLLGKPSIKQKLSGFVKCTADGTCYGYTDHFCEQSCNPATLLPTPSSASSISINITDSTQTTASGSSTPPPPPPPPPQLPQYARHSHVHTSPGTTTTPGHHHVANNKFLSIGVQTSLAIALHKIPEGFITYATNHASPSLGLSVFLALFIHNIAEGFIMALPLFLALRSRVKAVACASVLGGLSQPLGAGLAALAMRKGGGGEDEGGAAYGVLFAGTAGVMASVGVALFVQAVALKHGSRVPFVFGFVGMGVLGLSFALTADR